jgi:hypothetical protein
MSNACDGQRSSGHLAVLAWSTTQVGGAMILRTSWEVNQNGLGCIASERLSFTRLGKAFRGKPRSKPESGNPTFRDCRGARGNVTLSAITWCARLGSIPTTIPVAIVLGHVIPTLRSETRFAIRPRIRKKRERDDAKVRLFHFAL